MQRPPYGRRRLVAGLSCAALIFLVVLVAQVAGGGSGHPPHHRARAGTGNSRAIPAPGRLVLQVIPAAYQLPAAISREVVLPDPAASRPTLLVAGGLTTRSVSTDAVLLLDPVTGQTSQPAPLAVATHDAAGAVLDSRAVVFGGGSQSSIATVQSAAAHGSWSAVGRLPRLRSDLSAVTVGGRAYLLGGYDGTSYDRSVLATADGTHFTVAAKLPVAVRYPAVAAAGSRIWVFGGQTPAGITSVIQQVDTATGKATIVGRLPAPLAHATGFTLGGRVFVAGGQTAPAARRSEVSSPSAQGTTSRDVLEYLPASGGTRVAGQLPVPVANAASAVLGSTAYLLGGDDGGRNVPEVTTFRLVPVAAVLPPAAFTASTAAAAPVPASAPWLAPPSGPGHLAPGSNPAALPGDVLIADHRNNRLLIIDPQGRVRWQFPRPGDLARGQSFLVPDDAFFSPDGKYIIATQEDDFVISVIDMAQHKIVYRYGTPGVPGSGPDHLNNPDDALLTPTGRIVAADIKNCRIVMIAPPVHSLLGVIGQTTNACVHAPPRHFGSPNGAFPLTDGRYLVTEINGSWASEMSLSGRVAWSVHPPGVLYPSDTNEVYPGRYLTADYSSPGQVVEFGPHGGLLWRFRGLNQPSLALPLPNGDILVNDDFNHRIIVIDPVTNRIVWQYGHTHVAGSAPGYLNDPDGVDLVPPYSMLITHAATMAEPPLRGR
ncbi:MAG TPA: hypothetical protein VGS62_09460 [Streptosporangiaceae bacterium]|nr:hypothetical protein [Streptosporangiaceae bacterium]